MKFLTKIITLGFIFFFFGANAQFSEKFSDVLIRNIEINRTNPEYTVWIFFTDKGSDLKAKIKFSENNLSKKSIQRRQKLIKTGPVADYYDIPVKESYVEQLIPHINKLRHQSRWLNAISAEVSRENLEQIAGFSFVKKIDIVRKGKYDKKDITKNRVISENFIKSTMYDFNYGSSLTQLEQINVPPVHDLGYSGNGVIICVLDAGFNNLEHQAFTSMDIADQWDFVNNDGNVDDEGDMGSGSHGTMTLSTIGGFYEGQLIGPAFGATYLLAKTENTDSETQVEEDNWVAGAEWADALGVDITSTSLGYIDFDDGTGYSPAELDGNTAIITIAADIAAGKGILVVNSAGNEGGGTTTIGAPADGDSVLAVGAVYSDGSRTFFSSVGPTGDGRIKPEVMAMGSDVYVADTYGNYYTTASGTSFSCPLTAGAAALLWEMVPNASNMDIFEALKMTANNADAPNNQYGWGIIDIYAAYEYLAQIYSYSVTFNVTDGTNTIENANVNFLSQDKLTNASGQAVFSNLASGNDIQYTVTKAGYVDYQGTLSIVDQNVTENVILSLTDIEEVISENNILLSPNPEDNFIKIHSINKNNKINEVFIYNISGQVQRYITDMTNSEINISNLIPGIYICKIIGTKQTSVSKFIISR